MAIMVNNCPRCGSQKITFQVKGVNFCGYKEVDEVDRAEIYEVYAVCKECNLSTIFIAQQLLNRVDLNSIQWNDSSQFNLSNLAVIIRTITPADLKVSTPPKHLPQNIHNIYIEGAKCLSIGCYNAAATMFRLCLDYATKNLLPAEGNDPNNKIRRSLGLRMDWLFDNELLPTSLRELAECVKNDGNDGAHEGILEKDEAIDLEEFSFMLLERIFTEKERLAIAKRRRIERNRA
ncbi:DUF4145 domain-containing protein [Lonsdalea quercina]|uniref:DUF4145 domain-containing protein n=1 Tax=Lonsdalea quercina TaxID=71657 RepID=UPI0039771DA6